MAPKAPESCWKWSLNPGGISYSTSICEPAGTVVWVPVQCKAAKGMPLGARWNEQPAPKALGEWKMAPRNTGIPGFPPTFWVLGLGKNSARSGNSPRSIKKLLGPAQQGPGDSRHSCSGCAKPTNIAGGRGAQSLVFLAPAAPDADFSVHSKNAENCQHCKGRRCALGNTTAAESRVADAAVAWTCTDTSTFCDATEVGTCHPDAEHAVFCGICDAVSSSLLFTLPCREAAERRKMT
eukprot:gene13361-biopygen8013